MKKLHDLLHALNSAMAVLLATENGTSIETSILKAMGIMGQNVGVDRVQVWRNEAIGGILYFVHKLEWLSNDGHEKAAVPVGLSFPYSIVPDWERKFVNEGYINSPISSLSESDQVFLNTYDIKSIVIIPLFIKEQFWGFFSLDDCNRERTFTDDEISVLRSAGLLMANALLQSNMLGNLPLGDARENFEIIRANVDCGITLIDAETRKIIDVNPTAAQMFGARVSDIIGSPCHKFLCPAEEHSCPILDKKQLVDRSERELVRADGTVIPVIKSVVKIQYNGRLTLLESFTDISNIKEAEEMLRHVKITEHSNRVKGEILSHMSHEMRTPLNAIIGMTSIGKVADSIEEKEYALNVIENASTHLLGIINDVLDMATIEAGKFRLSLAEFEFAKMIRLVVNVMSYRMDERQLRFNQDIDPAIPSMLVGDSQRLVQIITSLLGNAVKFTPEGGTVTLGAKRLKEKGNACTIRFEVTDTGIGIASEKQGDLFQSFYQADNGAARKYGGTGLGLSIAKNIVDMMGGEIWVNSEIGKGSTFVFSVPLKCANSDSALPAIRP